MFNDKYAYNSSIRKAIVAFGTLFNSIYIKRKDDQQNTVQTLAVPLTYGPKQKFIQRINEAPTLDSGRATFENIVPAIGFEITGLSYDASRKLQLTQQTRTINNDNTVSGTFVSTPYNLNISLTAWAKNQEDGLQIIEQILPYFNPDFSVPVIDLPELGIKKDIQIVLNTITFTDDYTGNYEQRVALLWEFDFTMKINLYGFIAPIGIIKTAIANIYAGVDPTDPSTSIGEKVTATTDPTDVAPTGSFNYVLEFDNIGF